MNKTLVVLALVSALSGALAGCATEDSRSLAVAKPAAASRAYVGARSPISVG